MRNAQRLVRDVELFWFSYTLKGSKWRVFRSVRKISNWFHHVCLSVGPSFRLSAHSSVSPWVCPHRTIPLSLEDFYERWYLRIFQKSVQNIQVSLKSDNNNGTSRVKLCIFMIISGSILLKMKNILYENFTKIKTHISCEIYFVF